MENEWVDKAERLPTAEDADTEGVVLAWHRYQGVMLAGWFRVGESDMYTHWQHTPGPPHGYDALREVHLII